MKRCDDNIKDLQAQNARKDEEIERKKKLLMILKKKSERINQQKTSVEQYQTFLERVKEASDEYDEILKITERYKTLKNSKEKLERNLEDINEELESKKQEVSKYENSMETKIMTLNNEIATLTTRYEQVENEKQSLKNDEEETSAKKWEQVSELSRAYFAIDMLANKCLNIHGSQSVLRYDPKSLYGAPQLTDFNQFNAREDLALKQLLVIGRYLKDFRTIIGKFEADRVAGKIKIAGKGGDDDSEEDQ